MGDKPVILYLEADAEATNLVRERLRAHGVPCDLMLVRDRQAFDQALDARPFDAVLSAWNLPGYGGLEAVRACRDKNLRSPVILIAEAAGEEEEIACLESGAAGLVTRQKLDCLAPLLKRALAEKAERDRFEEDLRALGDSEARYRAFFENSLDAVFLTSPDGTIHEANPAACAMLGRTEAEIKGLGRQGVLDPEAPRNTAALEERARTGQTRAELTFIRSDGTKVRGESSSMIFKDSRGARRACVVVHDLTDRMKIEEYVLRLNRVLQALVKIGALVVRESDRQILLDGVCSILVEVGGFQMAWFGFKGEVPGEVDMAASAGQVKDNLRDIPVRWDDSPAGRGPTGTAIREGRAVIGPDTTSSAMMSPLREKAPKARHLASAAIPIIERGCISGALTVYDSESRSIGPEEEGLLQELAATVGHALSAITECVEHRAAESALEARTRDLGAANLRLMETQSAALNITEDAIEAQQRAETAIEALRLEIDEHKRASAALMRSEERYRLLFERNVAGVYRSRVGGGVLECNVAFAKIFGYETPEQVIGLPVEEYYSLAEDLLRFREQIARDGAVTNMLTRGRKKDGATLWLLENATIIADETGKANIIQGTCLDVTDIRKADEEQRLLRTTIEQAHDHIVITDPNGAILFVNEAFEAVTGYSRAEVLGENPRILKSGYQDDAFYRKLWETISSGQMWSGRLVNKRKDMSLFTEHALISPVKDQEGHIVAYVALKRDISKEEQLQDRLAHAQTLETVGMIASGVAHEVRNPLFAISTVVAALTRKLKGQTEFEEYAKHIQEHVDRLKLLMNDLLMLGRPIKPEEFQRTPMQEIVEVALGLADAAYPGASKCYRVELPEIRLVVMGNLSKLAQAVLNLLQNAYAFSPDPESTLVRLTAEDSLAVLTISDEGPGIPRDMLPSLFAPFQSRRKGGTGLGLAIVRQIVLAHGGSVQGVNNNPAPGATFTIRLPAGM